MNSIFDACQGMILDFDGLLADSEPFHFKAYNTVFERYGHTLDPEEYWVEFTSKGKGIAGEIERHNLKLDVDPKEMRRQKFEEYSKFCQSGEIKLFPGSLEMVKSAARRYSLAIASGSWSHDIQTILGHAGAEDLIPIILGKESASREKPHPDIFLKAADEMDLAPSRCVVVEDALKGLKAAKEARMHCVIIRNPLNEKIDFAGANLVLPNLKALAQLIEG